MGVLTRQWMVEFTLRKHAASLIVLLLSVSSLASLPQTQATTWQVPGDYTTIQAAVDAAAPGDTVEVSPDVYPESVIVSKSLTITGQDKSTTIVEGSESGYAFWLDADGVTIQGFTLRDCSNYGVLVSSSGGHIIRDNIFLNNGYGVYISYSPSANNVANNTFYNNHLLGIKVAFSNDNTISHNNISESAYGIRLSDESQLNSITNNLITGTSHGIYINYAPNNYVYQNNIESKKTGVASVNSDYTDIRNNTVSGCAHGIEVYNSMYNTVQGNTAAQNSDGMYLVYANDNTIDSNLASNNDWGIRLYDSDSNTILQNTFSFNAYGIDLISTSNSNTIAWNNILNNTLQMHQDSTSGGNIWNKATGGETYGSHWSNYPGEDTDGDGVGETLLPHMGVDNYPLMNPWSTVHDPAVISVATSDNEVYQGEVVNITVVVRNEGTVTETFNVTAKYFNRIIETKTVTNLTRLKTTTIMFNWDTQSVPTDFEYAISAEATPVTGETDKADNTFIDGIVRVETPLFGDINIDGIINADDLILLTQAYGSTSTSPNWNPDADLNKDGTVNIFDLNLLCRDYGKTV